MEKNPAALSCHHCQVFVSAVVCFQCFDSFEDATFYATFSFRLGDILSQGQIVPTAFLGRQIVPSDKMSHFLPRDKLSHQTNCPISSPETKCPTDALIKNHCSTGIFRETNCPIRQIVPLSPRRQNVPTYALMHKKVMESCWDILSPVILSNFWETFERLLRDF